MTYRGPVARAVGAALSSAQLKPEDAAAVALVRRYAALIDDAAPASKYRDSLAALRRAVAVYDEPKAAEALEKITDALAAHSVASDLGPKLLTALTALGMTAAGRGAKGGGTGGPVIPDELAQLRQRARQRRARAD